MDTGAPLVSGLDERYDDGRRRAPSVIAISNGLRVQNAPLKCRYRAELRQITTADRRCWRVFVETRLRCYLPLSNDFA